VTFIAVIDDDPSVRKALQRLLRAARMEVETYGSGESFLLASPKKEPNCLVVDVRMPGMSGPELRERLVAMGRHIPFVYITAHAEGEAGQPGHSAEVLRKPFGDQALLEAIARVLRKGTGT
jgi:FixJ family two-component response regulator